MKLSKTRVKSIRADGVYADDTVTGLKLRVRDGRKNWIFRRAVFGKRYEVAIGPDDMDLDKVRDIASELRNLTPEEFSDRMKNPTKKEETSTKFSDVEKGYYQYRINAGDFERGDKYDACKYYVIRKFALPAFGDRDVNTITSDDVAKLLITQWDKPETVKRLSFMLREIFSWAKSRRLFSGDNPADKNGDLKFLLPKRQVESRHHGMLPLNRVPHFCRALWLHGLVSDFVFLFSVLTCVRASNARNARWEQIDMKEKTWTLSAQAMKIKANGGIVIPLSDSAIAVLERIGVKGAGWIFARPETLKPYSGGNFRKTIESMNRTADLLGYDRWIDEEQTRDLGKEVIASQHGIARACFKTWASSDEFDNDLRYNKNVVEACLHHVIDDGYRGAYDRGKRLIRKRELLNDWGKFCFSEIDLEDKTV